MTIVPVSGYDYRDVRPSEVVEDLRVNRPVAPGAMRRFEAAGFDPEALGTPELWQRSDGALVPVDGLQRLTYCKRIGYDEPITCKVHVGMHVQRAAALFRLLNLRTAVPAVQDFLKGVVEGDPEALAIDEILRQAGLVVEASPGAHAITCVDKLRTVYRGPRRDGGAPTPDALARTLHVIVGTWGFNAKAYHAMVVMGLGLVMHEHRGSIDDDDLIAKLKARVKTPKALLDEAEFWRDNTGASKPDCVASVIVNHYNVGRRSRRLPSWFS